MRIKVNIDIRINRVVKFLVLSDLLFIGSWSLIQPIFPIFIVQKIEGGSLIIVGLTAALYWLVKSSLQIPIANYLDKTEGEKDDFYALIVGLTLAGIAAFGFSLVEHIWQLFFAQFIYAIAMALYIPSWTGIFSRHLDEKRVYFDWSFDSAVVGFAAFVATFLSGFLAAWFGFVFVFLLVGASSLLSAALIFLVPDLIIPKKMGNIPPPVKERSPADINR